MESGKIIVVANQKGGVAKTSTVRNLSYALAEMGKKVLVVDFDPQYNLTTSFGVLPTQAPYNTGTLITNLLLDESLPDTNEFIQKIGSVDLIPSSRSLTVAEANLLMTPDSNDYLATVVAAAITSRKAKNSLPTHILLENVPGLAPTSLLLLEQLRTIDRKRLRGYIGRISKEKMLEVDAALAISIGIGYPNERRTHNV